MKRTLLGLSIIAAIAVSGLGIMLWSDGSASATKEVVPLKEAKLNIEHNATDEDTGFQGFIDSEGWESMEMTGPDGKVLSFKPKGALAQLGLTELFFETVEPENVEVSIEDVLAHLPEGQYLIEGKGMEAGENTGWTSGTALLTHDIPAGPELLTPPEDAVVPLTGVTMSWEEVTETIDGDPVTIIAYQLIVEKDEESGPNMIGKFGLSMYLPPDVTSITLPDGFLEAETEYEWEVLAIEESGNQTRVIRNRIIASGNSSSAVNFVWICGPDSPRRRKCCRTLPSIRRQRCPRHHASF